MDNLLYLNNGYIFVFITTYGYFSFADFVFELIPNFKAPILNHNSYFLSEKMELAYSIESDIFLPTVANSLTDAA